MSRLTAVRAAATTRRPRARVYDARTSAVEMVRHRRAWRVGPSRFEVISRNGCTRYLVCTDPDGGITCTCPAGRFRSGCWHRMKVLMRLLREAGGAMPVIVTAEMAR